MKARSAFFLLTVLAGVSSCIYPYDPQLENQPDKIVVVDGSIMVGGISTIKIDYLAPINSSAVAKPMGSAWIEDNLGKAYYPWGGAMAKGSSFTIQTADTGSAEQFRAVVEVDGKTYVSEWQTPADAPEITSIDFSADESTVYVTMDVKPGSGSSGYIGFLCDETWRFHSDICPEYYVNTQTWTYDTFMTGYEYYWCWRNSSSQQVSLVDYSGLEGDVIGKIPVKRFLRSDSRNHQRYSILVKAFAISKEAYDYNKRTQEISDIGGSLFTPDPGTLPSNLTCTTDPEQEVMGMVLAGTIGSRRAYLGNEYLVSRPVSTSEFVHVPAEEMETWYYNKNYRPAYYVTIGDVIDMGWVPHRCINCIEAGGTQTRPDFWED